MEYRKLQPGSDFAADPSSGLLLPPLRLDVRDFETDKPSPYFNRVVAEAKGERHLRLCSEPVKVEGHAEAAKEYAASFRHVDSLQCTGAAAVFISGEHSPEPDEVARSEGGADA